MTMREKRLQKAQMRTLFQVPFFAAGVAKLPVVFDDGVPTACTDGERVRWNPQFFDKLEDQQLVTVLCHEVAHCMLGHIWRAPGGCDWEQWNIATDHAVNNMLKGFSAQVMGQRLADPFPSPDGACVCDPAYAGLAEEIIYQRLGTKPPGQGGKSGGASGKGQGKKTSPGSNGAQKQGTPGPGQIEKPKNGPGSASKQGKLKNDWERVLIDACSTAKGDLPAGLDRLVDRMLNPAVPWWELLRRFLREQAADDYNFMVPDPYYADSGFLLPSLSSDRIGAVVFATDTSGSISDTLLAQYQSEKQRCLDDLRPARLVDIYCDAAIHKVKEYSPGEIIDRDAPGGGGTDFRPVWEHCANMPALPKCAVYLTDLYGDFGTDPGYPVLWVTWTKDLKAPFGETIYAGDL